MSKSTDLSTLGDRLKAYEATFESTIPDSNYIVIRLDGHGFSKFTKGLDKPFDSYFTEAMVATTNALILEFNAVCGYTQSDEITIILKPQPPTRGVPNQLYAGRIQKLVSLTAGFCSAKFNQLFKHHSSDKLPYFDSRAYGVESVEEAYNSIMWRCRDAEKNSKNVFAQTYCSHRSLLNLNSQQQIEFCLETTDNDWNSLPDHLKYGTTIYRTKQWVEADPTNPLAEPAMRTRLVTRGIDITSFDPTLLSTVLSVGPCKS